MPSNTVYAKQVRHALVDKEMSVNGLVTAVRERTGMYFDRSYLSKILNGKTNAPKMVSVINDILDIEEMK